ncbi:hypothetical protein [Aerococcus sp. HMSC10H05]|nr:hypothetical protein [Aerococcus sp. HMSC10H05]
MIEKRNQKYIERGEHKKVDGNIDNFLPKRTRTPESITFNQIIFR